MKGIGWLQVSGMVRKHTSLQHGLKVKKHVLWSLNFLLTNHLTLNKSINVFEFPYLVILLNIYFTGLFPGSN